MKVLKDSVGSKLLRKKKEPTEVGLTKADRNNILQAIKSYGSEDLEIDSLKTVIQYTWTLVQRAEEEWNQLNKTSLAIDELLNEIPDEPLEVSTTDRRPKKVKKPKITAYQLKEKVDRHIDNLTLLTKFSTLLKDLGKSIERQEVIKEKQLNQEFIKITQHSAVLDAYVKCMLLAMMEAGIPSDKKLEVVKRFQKINSEYPLITEDLASIHKRLFGTPEQVIDVQCELLSKVKAPTTPKSPMEERDIAGSLLYE